MNTRFNFRIYNHASKTMYYPTLITFDVLNNFYTFDYMGNTFAGRLEDIQQNTGLKDCRGTEIYEGDILKKREYEDWFDKEGFDSYHVVAWSTNQSKFSRFPYNNKEYWAKWWGGDVSVESLIVGNVFTHPDIIRKEPWPEPLAQKLHDEREFKRGEIL